MEAERSRGGYLDDAVLRIPLGDHVGKSGAPLERIHLADGRRVVVKRMTPATDLLMAASGDTVGREYLLWSAGVLDRLPPQVGHAVLDGWVEGDTTVLVMRDLGSAVLTWDDRLSRHQVRRLFAAVTAMHRAFVGDEVLTTAALTPLPDLLGLFAPQRMAPYADRGNPLVPAVLRGWEIFAETVPADLADAVLGLLADPAPLAGALASRPPTLIHGDLATVNVALEPDRVVLLDWAMPAAAPGAVDLARFLAGCASVVDATREDMIADFRELSGPADDETGLRLALLGALVWLGWNKALDAAEHPDTATRVRERADLDWWLTEARRTLDAGML